MFKVSLLPASYRKSLLSKKRRNLIEKVAVIVLFCLLVVYAGIAARYIILNAQLRKVNKQNMMVEAQIQELQQYKTTYDALEASKAKVEAIKAPDMSAMEFVSVVQATRPENIRINAIATQDWQNSAVRSAVNELNAYADTFTKLDEYKGTVKQVKIANNGMPVKDSDTGAYSFTIVVSLNASTSLEFDENGIFITTEPTSAEETTTAAENANEGENAENSETPTEETTTAAEDTQAEETTGAEG